METLIFKFGIFFINIVIIGYDENKIIDEIKLYYQQSIII
jgi:hypothetical protein